MGTFCFSLVNIARFIYCSILYAFVLLLFGQPFAKWFALCYRTVVLSVISCLSVCNVGVLWPNGWADQDETWCAGSLRPWPHCVRWGPSSPPLKGHSPPYFRSISVAAKWPHGSRMPLGIELSLGPGDFVLDGDPAPPPKKGAEPPKFSARVYCGQTAGWIEMVLGMEVGLSPNDFVLDGDPAPSPKRGWSPLSSFRPICIVARRLDASRCHLVWR